MSTTLIRRAGATAAVTGIMVIGSATASFADVGPDEAGKTVTDQYGGNVISVESDSEKGEATWEVEVENSNRGRIEVDVSKASGQIVAIEAEDDDDDASDGTDVDDGSDPSDEAAGTGDTDGDGDVDGDDGTGTGDTDGDGDVDGDDAQVSPAPAGGVDTGAGGTDGVEHQGVLAGAGAAALAGGTGLLVVLRRRSQRTD